MIVSVKKLTLITLSQNEERLLHSLGRLGVVHLRKLDETEFAGFKEATSEKVREYETLLERLHSLREKMNISLEELKGKPSDLDIAKVDLENVRAEVDRLENAAKALVDEIHDIRERLKSLSEIKPTLQALQSQGVNPGDLGDFKHIFTKAGVAKTNLMPLLRLRLKTRKDITFREASLSAKDTFLYVSGLMELKPWVEKLLATVEFKEFKLPDETPEKVDEALKWVEDESRTNEQRIQSLENQWNNLKREYVEKALTLEASIKYLLGLATAQSHLLRSRMMIILQGWVPEDRINELDMFLKGLNRELGGNVAYSYETPLPEEEVPTIMKNPKLFRAYETLTRQYGYPDPRESDPTVISTILWITMFGLMFPDLGQGLAILGLGVLFAYVIKKPLMGINAVRLGRLMIGLGASAAFFGLLAGEFFLMEIQPLWPGLMPAWVKYSANVIWLIKIAVFFGIAQIILGLTLSIRNHLRAGETLEALLGEKGLAGLITFLGIVLLAFHFLGINILPGVGFPELKLAVIRHWTIAVPIIGVIGIAVKPMLSGEGATMSLGVVIETLTSSFANMLSYARIAGFCIAHAAFALVVAELLHSNPALGIGLGLIFLNMFALTLELMVVMIQALRLLYYEFSTKFFKGTGIPYTPYRIKV
ncbi:MAG: V-type ATPase 116kDa subunit family protein [Candidatus Bathyarchaeia archaeon]